MVCVEERLLDEFPQTGHFVNHGMCTYCLQMYMKCKILDDGMTSLLCPTDTCKAPLEYQEIEKYAARKVFARFILYCDWVNMRYDELLCRRAFEADPNFRWCLNPRCGAGQIVANGSARPVFMANSSFQIILSMRNLWFPCLLHLSKAGSSHAHLLASQRGEDQKRTFGRRRSFNKMARHKY